MSLRQVSLLITFTLLSSALAPMLHAQPQVVPAKAATSPLDQPIALLQEAKRNYGVVKDYTCTLVSQERVRGKLEEQSIMTFKMKTEPFSVYMKWLAPRESVNQEVAFVMGKNNNKMRVKSNRLGEGKLLGFMSIDPNDPRVLERSKHNILEAGLGVMIDQNIAYYEKTRKIASAKVDIAEAKYNDRDCIRIEVAVPQRDAGAYCYRSVMYLEKTSKLPIRLENYDWPQAGGAPGGDLIEMFSYVNLRFNVGLTNEDFAK
jgi:hypothetical protein